MINSAVSKAHFDAILDCGASDIFFPAIHEDKTTDVIYQSGSISLSDKSSVDSYAVAKYGMLEVTLSNSHWLLNKCFGSLFILHKEKSLHFKENR